MVDKNACFCHAIEVWIRSRDRLRSSFSILGLKEKKMDNSGHLPDPPDRISDRSHESMAFSS